VFRSACRGVIELRINPFGGHAVVDIEVGGDLKNGKNYLAQLIFKGLLLFPIPVDVVHDGPDSLHVLVGLDLLIDHLDDLLALRFDRYIVYFSPHIAERLELPPVELNGSWIDIEGQEIRDPLEELHLLVSLEGIRAFHKHLGLFH
jgi:hypothetical protein